MNTPRSFAELVSQFAQLKDDIEFVRQLKKAEFLQSTGTRRFQRTPGSDNTILDLRDAASAVPTIGKPPTGENWDAITQVWINRALAAGGTFTNKSKAVQDAFVRALKVKPYFSKIVYMMTFIGGNLATARVPIIDTLGLGIAGSVGFVEADFNELTGITGGTTKYFEPGLVPGAVNSGNIGYGWWELANPLTSGVDNVDMMGCYSAGAPEVRNTLDSRVAGTSFLCGQASSGGHSVACQVPPTVQAHVYGQRTSATNRKGYVNGNIVGASTTSITDGAPSDNDILISGGHEGSNKEGWPGRGRIAYVTTGNLADSDVADLHSLLQSAIVVGIVNGVSSPSFPGNYPTVGTESECAACLRKIVVSNGEVMVMSGDVVTIGT